MTENPNDVSAVDPKSLAMSAFTAAVFHAFDQMWAAQPDPARIFGLWRIGAGHFVVRADRVAGLTIDFVRGELEIDDVPPEIGGYL